MIRFTPTPGRVAADLDALLAAGAIAIGKAALPALTPAAYLRLRRKAAGLSILQVASRLPRKVRLGRASVSLPVTSAADMLRNLERDGFAARDTHTIRFLPSIFRIDLNVYAQLRDEPDPRRHPAICRGCGCSKGLPCRIVERGSLAAAECTIADGLCSICTTIAEPRQ